jgi:hypothetical protein
VSGDLLLLLTPLRQALERIERKACPLLANPGLLDSEEGQDLPDVICMQFLVAGDALMRAMGFRDVIAHQYFDLDAEQVLLICQEALPGVLEAIRTLEASRKEGT